MRRSAQRAGRLEGFRVGLLAALSVELVVEASAAAVLTGTAGRRDFSYSRAVLMMAEHVKWWPKRFALEGWKTKENHETEDAGTVGASGSHDDGRGMSDDVTCEKISPSCSRAARPGDCEAVSGAIDARVCAEETQDLYSLSSRETFEANVSCVWDVLTVKKNLSRIAFSRWHSSTAEALLMPVKQ
jgi:hypothetical protein